MKKQLLICLLAFFGPGHLLAQSCLPDGIELTSQSQIDSFPINYPSCSEILGNILISESIPNNITNLDSLNQIETINGWLRIEYNTSLSDITGLENLTIIGDGLRIINNPSLASLSGLDSLTVVSDLFVTYCDALESLTGLEGLTTLGGSLNISANPLLTDLWGLHNLLAIDGVIELSGNVSMTNLSGLDSLTTIISILIQSNDALVDFSGLDNLVEIVQYFTLANNNTLTDFTGLGNLSSIGTAFLLFTHDSLTSFSGLSSLERIEVFSINNCDQLIDLAGLENVDTLGSFIIEQCDNLQNLDAIGNADLSHANVIRFQANPALSICGQSNICDYIMEGGAIELTNNAPGCNNVSEILQYCFENIDHTSLVGQVIADLDEDCQADSSETGISNWLTHVSFDEYSYGVTTNDSGYYWLPVLEGDWTLNVISPSSFWTSCFEDTLIQATAMNDTIVTNFYMQPLGDCSFVDWDIAMPNLRPCDTRTLVVNYCNYGTQIAEDVIISLSLDTFLTFQGASYPFTIDTLGNILFEFDQLDIFECGQFTIDVFVDCNALTLWEVQCVHAELITEELCSPDTLWDGSTIKVNGFCENDSIYFKLENIGTGNMTLPAQFRVDIVIDDIVMLQDVDNYQLNVGEIKMLNYPIEGTNVIGMRLEADQSDGHPVNDVASVVVPNCNDLVNNIILNLLPAEDGSPYEESFCGLLVNSYDPNIKTVIPVGIGDNHEIDKSWKLDYTIEFQNTGNDTAFLVVVKDTLSEQLDITTLRVGGASHSFSWALNPERELVFTFDNIQLLDSTSNEPESHGFVNFSISPRVDLLPGERIENRVGIYFDFNDPVITNTVFNTIRKPVVASSEHLDWCAGQEYQGEQIWQDTSVQILTEYIEYDSVHFVHIEVLPFTIDTVFTDVAIGDYFENILILGDTIFTLSYENQEVCDSLVAYFITGLTDVKEVTSLFKNTRVYPNPVSEYLQVSGHQNNNAQQWELVNNLGIVVWNKQLSTNQSLAPLSMAPFPPGVYWLQVKTDATIAVWKVIKR